MEIAIDFDGTCVTHDFPDVGKDIGAVPVLKKLVDNGHKLILYTMRSDRFENKATGHDDISDVVGEFLNHAKEWFNKNDIPLFAAQANPSQCNWTTSPKCYAHLYIDDAALGCPLKVDYELSERPFVDWNKVEDLLKQQGLIKN